MEKSVRRRLKMMQTREKEKRRKTKHTYRTEKEKNKLTITHMWQQAERIRLTFLFNFFIWWEQDTCFEVVDQTIIFTNTRSILSYVIIFRNNGHRMMMTKNLRKHRSARKQRVESVWKLNMYREAINEKESNAYRIVLWLYIGDELEEEKHVFLSYTTNWLCNR